MIRITLKIALGFLILAISHPYAFFSFALYPLHVTIYADERDQDEDVFVSRIDEGDGSADLVYQEESGRDHDQKNKLKLKIKIEFFPNQICFCFEPLMVKHNGDSSFISPKQDFITCLFHPPNLSV